MQGIANLFISHGKLRLGLDEISRERDQIAQHRDSLEKSLTERDHALAIRDQFVAERTRELEQAQQQYQLQLQAIVEHRDSLERSLSEKEGELRTIKSSLIWRITTRFNLIIQRINQQ